MTVFAIVLILVLMITIALLLTGLIPIKGRNGIDNTGNMLRNLLHSRADGKISQAEFETQQASLHAQLLDSSRALPGTTPKFGKKILLLAAPTIVVLTALGVYLFQHYPKDAETVSSLPASSANASQITDETNQNNKKTLANTPSNKPTNTPANKGGDLSVMAKRLADKMEQSPNDGQGWLLLARTHSELRQSGDAAKAFAKAAALLPADAGMLADWADAYVVSHDRKWDSDARGIIKRALATDPKHLKTLSLAGSEAYERADYKAAIGFWTRMQAVAPADSIDAKLADTNIKEATAKMNSKK